MFAFVAQLRPVYIPAIDPIMKRLTDCTQQRPEKQTINYLRMKHERRGHGGLLLLAGNPPYQQILSQLSRAQL
jgi:hypothetical protein